MVYKFLILSDEVDHFAREIEIDSEATFLELNDAILESVGYTKDQLTSFSSVRTTGRKKPKLLSWIWRQTLMKIRGSWAKPD